MVAGCSTGDSGALSLAIGGRRRLTAGDAGDASQTNVVVKSSGVDRRIPVRSAVVNMINRPVWSATTAVNAIARRTLQVFGPPTQASAVPESRNLLGNGPRDRRDVPGGRVLGASQRCAHANAGACQNGPDMVAAILEIPRWGWYKARPGDRKGRPFELKPLKSLKVVYVPRLRDHRQEAGRR